MCFLIPDRQILRTLKFFSIYQKLNSQDSYTPMEAHNAIEAEELIQDKQNNMEME